MAFEGSALPRTWNFRFSCGDSEASTLGTDELLLRRKLSLEPVRLRVIGASDVGIIGTKSG